MPPETLFFKQEFTHKAGLVTIKDGQAHLAARPVSFMHRCASPAANHPQCYPYQGLCIATPMKQRDLDDMTEPGLGAYDLMRETAVGICPYKRTSCACPPQILIRDVVAVGFRDVCVGVYGYWDDGKPFTHSWDLRESKHLLFFSPLQLERYSGLYLVVGQTSEDCRNELKQLFVTLRKVVDKKVMNQMTFPKNTVGLVQLHQLTEVLSQMRTIGEWNEFVERVPASSSSSSSSSVAAAAAGASHSAEEASPKRSATPAQDSQAAKRVRINSNPRTTTIKNTDFRAPVKSAEFPHPKPQPKSSSSSATAKPQPKLSAGRGAGSSTFSMRDLPNVAAPNLKRKAQDEAPPAPRNTERELFADANGEPSSASASSHGRRQVNNDLAAGLGLSIPILPRWRRSTRFDDTDGEDEPPPPARNKNEPNTERAEYNCYCDNDLPEGWASGKALKPRVRRFYFKLGEKESTWSKPLWGAVQ